MSFLIRDWQFPDEHKYGFEGGKELLKKRLEVIEFSMGFVKYNYEKKKNFEKKECKVDIDSKKELNELIANFKNYFKKRNCFLLPHPGAVITKKDYNGEIKSKVYIMFNLCQVKIIMRFD